MEIVEIIKNSFKFPSQKLGILAIYIIFSILIGIFALGGIVVYILGLVEPQCFLFGGLSGIIAMLIGFIVYGYNISVIKSGIETDDEVPEFEWWENFNRGFDNFIVSIVYFLIPAIIVALVAVITDLPGRLYVIFQEILAQTLSVGVMGEAIEPVSTAMSYDFVGLIAAISITALIALVLFIIFSFLQTIAQARLANTGSLAEALNFVEAAKDIRRIGIVKVVAVILLLIIITGIINMILTVLPILSILTLIISPYLTLVTQRAVGLLYSDIA